MSHEGSPGIFVPVLPSEQGIITAHRRPEILRSPDALAIAETMRERAWSGQSEHYLNFVHELPDGTQTRTAFRVNASETRQIIGSANHTRLLKRTAAHLQELAARAPVVTVFISTPVIKQQAA